MILREMPLKGAFIIEMERLEDERGFFARAWCQKEVCAHTLSPHFVQANVSFSKKRGTLRGMHYQVAPYEEAKVVRCTRGSIYDVIIDLRPESATYKQWVAVELTAANRKMIYVPEGFAHGFQTMEDDTEIFYQVSAFHAPEAGRGVRWDDPTFAIDWPTDVVVISEKDKRWPYYME